MMHGQKNIKSSGCCLITRFKVQKLFVLSTEFIYVFCIGLRTNSG